jgi:beta-lactamase regulating signal transducer with metallopeptidase domain
MSVLIAIALKSLLIGALTLGLLHFMRKRSAAERSWVAHVGLLALMIMAFAPMVLPSWNVEAPAMLGRSQAAAPGLVSARELKTAPVALPKASVALPSTTDTPVPSRKQAAPRQRSLDPVAVATAVYAVPAAILLFITFLALARLVALQARAEVLVDGHWLSALARAQRRMGFKHGTALLTSDELASPISWGLMRPVILLNSRAVEAADEAEAIIAHELAHVARLDWIKLLLARIATALFWFNPLVWLLAREAHQLREETADDTVLAADIADTDYAQLLVGVARHECPGLLLGAHGVAPSKSSLARRIARVLDVKSPRGPAARGFALGVFAGAVLVAAPLAALTLTPGSPNAAASSARAPRVAGALKVEAVRTDLPHIIAQGVSTSVSTAMAAVAPPKPAIVARTVSEDASDGDEGDDADGATITRNPDGSTITVYPTDSQGSRKVIARAADGRTIVRYGSPWHDGVAVADARAGNPAVAVAVESKGLAITPEFIAAIRAAAPELGDASLHQIRSLRALGVTPEFARSIASAGFPSMTAHDLMEARAVGLSAAYVNAMRSAGVKGDLDDFVQLRAVGVDPSFAARARSAGVRHLDADTLIEMGALDTVRLVVSPKNHTKMRMKDRRAPAPPGPDDLNESPHPDG